MVLICQTFVSSNPKCVFGRNNGKDFMKTYNMEKIKEQSSEYQKLCAMLRKQADEGGLQLSDAEIRKGADRLMGYLELVIRIHHENESA